EFAFTAILTLALGIGATTAVFSVVEQMLLTQLPYREPDRIVALQTFFTDSQRLHPRVTGGDYQDMRNDPAFASIAFYQGGEMGVQLPDHATFTQIAMVSPGFPDVFRVHPERGALFRPGDASHQALVSEAFADAELGGVSAAVGKLVSMESESYQVIGVMPRGFDFPQKTSIWLGASATPDNVNRNSYNYHAVARLDDGLDLQQAQLRLNALSTRLAKQFPVDQAHVELRAVPLRDALTGGVRTSLWLWLAAVGVLLLIACANVAHLQLVRISAQGQALAVRSALGAPRARIVSSVLLEAGLVSFIGGAAGLLLSIPTTRLLMHLLSSQLPRSMSAAPDLRLLGFCMLLAAIVTVLSAALPCWWAARRDPAAALSRGTRSSSTDRGTVLWRRGLLVLEIALSFLLVTTSGLLLRTLQHIHETPLGFASENRLVVYAHAPARGLAEMQKRVVELAQLTAQMRELPGVVSAAQTMGLPAGQYGSNGDYAVSSKGQAFGQAGLPHANFSLAGPGYFSDMRIPLMRGRDVTASDTYGSQPVAIISASLARQTFGGSDPLGQRIICGWDEDSMRGATIVGVVGDVRQDSPADEPVPTIYMPLAQHPYLANEVQIVLRTATAPATLIPAVRQRVLAADATIAIKFTTMDDALAAATEPQQLRGELLTAFAALALLLAAVGMYSVTSYTVAQQVREIGIRMALGADRAVVAREVMTSAAKGSLLGIGLGVLVSLEASRVLSRFLVGVPALDPASYGVAACVLVAAAALAALIPARRAASTEPVVALRTE
ncbi:MAG TPA: ABC transporter permease, partial [Acidobacteriaceae bacterium]|nr:ABC transporter permease [Acidobacteriaceae bacterium]